MRTFGLRGKDLARMDMKHSDAPPRGRKYSALAPRYLSYFPD